MKKVKLLVIPSYRGKGIKVLGDNKIEIESLPSSIVPMMEAWQNHYDKMVEGEYEIKIGRLYELGKMIHNNLKMYLSDYSLRYAKILEIKNQLTSDMFLLAKEKESLNQNDEAIKILEKRLSLNPTNLEFNFDHAVFVFNNQDYNRALELLTNIRKQDEENLAILFCIGLCHYKLSNNLQAATIFDSLLSKHPNELSFIMASVENNYDLGNYETSIQLLNRALLISPDNPEMLLLLAELYNLTSNLESEGNTLLKLVKVSPNDPKAWKLLGECFTECELFHEAIKCYKEILRIDPNQENVYYKIALLYYTLQMDQNALDFYINAILRNPVYAKHFWTPEPLMLQLEIDEEIKHSTLKFGAEFGDENAKKYLAK